MLTADLVRARPQGEELRVAFLTEKTRARAEELGAIFMALAQEHVGKTRDELESALAEVPVIPRERRLADGLAKLTLDKCVFDSEPDADPVTLRRELFLRATRARRGNLDLSKESPFDRNAILEELAKERGTTCDAIDSGLYADLRGAQVLTSVASIAPDRLADSYDLAQVQAVLLRATKVWIDVRCSSAGAYRALFHKLKFLRLLCDIRKNGDGYRLEIDGPFSLFESVTKYGLELALFLPALGYSDEWNMHASVNWGKARERLTFHASGKGRGESVKDLRLPDNVQALATAWSSLESPWSIAAAPEVLHVAGAGLCVPDLLFEHRDSHSRVYLEVMGYWSRDAVWKRIELVAKGLPFRVLFAISEKLRVSEAALDSDLPSALYVYKRTMSPAQIAERLDRMTGAR